MASITDKISRVSTGAGRPNSAVVQAPRTVGGASLSCDDLTNWTTDDVSYLAVYTLDTAGKIIPGSQVDFKGIVTGNTINNLVVTGGTDRAINVGDIVIAVPTAQYAKDLGDNILTSHNQDGTLKNKIATLGKIHGGSTDGVLTTDASGNVVSTPKLPADKLDFATLLSSLLTNPKFIQQGRSPVGSSGSTITFSVPFDNAPRVILTAQNTSDNTPETAKVTSASTGSFNAQFFYGDTRASGQVNWIAIDLAALSISQA